MQILMLMKKHSIYQIFLSFTLIALANSTLSKNDRKGGNIKRAEEESTSRKEQHQWAENTPSSEEGDEALKNEILVNYNKLDTGKRKFTDGITLGYVTVWNNHGYDVAKWAAKKFTHISPVWFQLKSAQIDGQLTCRIDGMHDIDMGWIEDILKNNSNAKIVPRFLFEGWNGNDLKQILSEEQAQHRCVRAIIQMLSRTHFDGAVMEIWLQIMAMTRGTAVDYLLEMVEFWAKEFHKAGLLFILPLSPPLNDKLEEVGIVNRDVIARLLAAVDYVNVMTYDFPSPEITGVAPIKWVEANIRYFIESVGSQDNAAKILMGLNFYGYDRTGGGSEAVMGKKYIDMLSSPDSMLTFDEQVGEHRLTFGRDGIIYYPSIHSIQFRLDLSKRLGLGGVAIWDLGQGLNHFTSVL